MKRLQAPRWRAGLLLACTLPALAARPVPGPAALVRASASQQAAAADEDWFDVIESRSDVLPEAVLAELPPDAGRRVLGGAHRIFLLVNPGLRSGDCGGADLPAAVEAALCRPEAGQPAAVYKQLNRVFREYLELFFAEVNDGDSLRSLVQMRVPSRLLLVTADAQPWARESERGPRLAVRVWMRLWRVELYERAPYAVKGVELLYSDRAVGDVPMPRPGEGNGDDANRPIYEAYRGAVIRALRGQIALSLWGSPRMLSTSWLGERPDAIGAALGAAGIEIDWEPR